MKRTGELARESFDKIEFARTMATDGDLVARPGVSRPWVTSTMQYQSARRRSGTPTCSPARAAGNQPTHRCVPGGPEVDSTSARSPSPFHRQPPGHDAVSRLCGPAWAETTEPCGPLWWRRLRLLKPQTTEALTLAKCGGRAHLAWAVNKSNQGLRRPGSGVSGPLHRVLARSEELSSVRRKRTQCRGRVPRPKADLPGEPARVLSVLNAEIRSSTCVPTLIRDAPGVAIESTGYRAVLPCCHRSGSAGTLHVGYLIFCR